MKSLKILCCQLTFYTFNYELHRQQKLSNQDESNLGIRERIIKKTN